MKATLDILARFASLLDGVSEWTGRAVSWLTLGMVLVTFCVVVLRYALNLGWIAVQESVTYLHAFVFMLGAAYTLKHDGHVRVDILYRKLPERTRAWIDLCGTVLLLTPVCLFIIWSSWPYVTTSWSLVEGSQEAGGLDLVFLLKTAIPLMALLVLLQGCAQAIHALLIVSCKQTGPDEHGGTHETEL
jgi:TRAP-type mannitol/chloroaromatic compound transport system permease small subunit